MLLNDDQVSRFITDGFLTLDSGLPAATHRSIYAKIQRVLRDEGNPGNNILPAVPELQQVLDSPAVRGALTSVLGENYLLHPHRYVHNNEPAEDTPDGPAIGKGSHSFVGWHQDSHSPLARPRHHYPRYAMILYYPQDTPPEVGPTQVIPATHLNRSFDDADRARGVQASGPAGTCVLTHFDIVHGGSLNLSENSRYMAKFVFARVDEPIAPSWNCQRTDWQTPEDRLAPEELPGVWSHLWDWMSGRTPSASGGDGDSIDALDGDEYVRQSAIYSAGASDVDALIGKLRSANANGWREGAVVMENAAYALAAVGEPAVPPLMSLLDDEDEWIQINAAFALGEIGTRAKRAARSLVAKLASPSHRVVRTALDAIGQIGVAAAVALPGIARLLTESNPEWQVQYYREWTGENQVRINAMMALIRLGYTSDAAVEAVVAALDDPCGYVTGFGVEYLLRTGSPSGLQAAIECLRAHRWDNTLKTDVRTY